MAQGAVANNARRSRAQSLSRSTSREIAERLVLGVSVAKTPINHLFQKFGVSSRTQAIARGRELGLLDG